MVGHQEQYLCHCSGAGIPSEGVLGPSPGSAGTASLDVCHGQAGSSLEITEVFSGGGASVEEQPVCWVQFKQLSRTDHLFFL